MSSIEEKIVSLKFDNAGFKEKAKDSLKSLTDLENNLKSFGKRGLRGQIGRMALNGLTTALDSARGRFSALEVMGVTALANITNSAVNAGKQVVSALTVKPVMDGFTEYELKIKSMQTIMASTGEDVKTVNKYIEELNTYADKTIYSFSDMTENIGKFTNAGVKLPDAVAAIKGISNAAALAGSDAGQASHAMYNFAQALSAGYVKLIDWKSIEIAGMATKQFKDELIKTGVELGTLTKKGDKYISTTKSMTGKTSDAFDSLSGFTESLQSQWLSSDVLIKTLGKYASETTKIGEKANEAATKIKTFSQIIDTTKEALGTGWGTTFELIIGNIDEAKNLWTMVGDVIGNVINKTAVARNNMLKEWRDLGGRELAIETVKSAYESLLNILGPIKEAFNEIFPPLTAEKLIDMTQKVKDFVESLRLSAEQSKNLKDTFRGVFSVFKNIGQTIGAVANFVAPIFTSVLNGILNVTGALGRMYTGVDKITGFGNIVSEVLGDVSKDFAALSDAITHALTDMSIPERIHNFFQFIADNFKKFGSIDSIGSAIRNAFSGIADSIKGAIDLLLGRGSLTEKLNNALTAGALVGVLKFVTNMVKASKSLRKASNNLARPINIIKNAFSTIAEPANAAVSTLKAIGELMDQWQKRLKADILMQLAIAIGILAGSLAVLSSIDPEKLQNAIAAMSTLVADLVLGPGLLSKMQALTGQWGAGQLMAFAGAIALLAHSLRSLSELDAKSLAKGITALGLIIGAMTFALGKLSGPPMIKMLKQTDEFGKTVQKFRSGSKLAGVLAFAISICMIGEELQRIGKMDWGSIKKGIVGIGSIMAGLLIFSHYMDAQRMLAFDPKAMAGMLIMAGSLVIFANAMKQFENISPAGIIKGLVSLAAMVVSFKFVLSTMQGISKSLVFGGDILKAAAAMAIMGTAFRIFADAMTQFENISLGGFLKGIASFASMVYGMSFLMDAVDTFGSFAFIDSGLLVKVALAMTVVAVAFEIFADAMQQFEGMDWATFGMGLASFATMIGGVIVALNALNAIKINPASMLALGTSLIMIGAAFDLLAAGMYMMKDLDFTDIANGIIALSSVLVIFAAAAQMMTAESVVDFAIIAGGFLAIGAAVALFAPAMMLLSKIPFEGLAIGLAALAGTLLIFGAAATIFAPAVLGMMGCAAVFIELAAAFAIFGAGVALIGTGLWQISKAILSFSVMTGAQLAMATENITNFVASLLSLIPQIVGSFVDALLETVHRIAQNIAPILDDLFDIVKVSITRFTELIPFLVDTGAKLVLSVLKGVKQNLPAMVDAASQVIVQFCNSLAQNAAQLIDAGMHLTLQFFKGIGDGLSSHSGEVHAMIQSWVEGLASFMTSAFTGIFDALGVSLGEILGNVIGHMVESATASLPKIGQNLSKFATEASDFFVEMTGIDPEVLKGCKYLAEAIAILSAVSLVEGNGLFSILSGGKMSFSKMGKDLGQFVNALNQSSMSSTDLESVKNITKALDLVAGSVKNLPDNNVDISKFTKGINKAAVSIAGISQVPNLDKIDNKLVKSVENICKVISKVGEAAKTIPKSGLSFSSIIFGKNMDITKFATMIKKTANSFGKLATDEKVASIDKTFVTRIGRVCDIIKSVSELAASLPREGGIFNILKDGHFGEMPKSFDQFTTSLRDAMMSLGKLATQTGDNALVDTSKIDKSFVSRVSRTIDIIKEVSGLIKTMPSINSSGGAPKFNLEPFTTGIKDATISLAKLASQTGEDALADISKIDKDFGNRISTVVDIVNQVLPLTNKMPRTGGSIEAYTGEFKITPFTDMIVEAATALADLAGSGDVDMDLIDGDLSTKVGRVIDIINDMMDLTKDLEPTGGTLDNLNKVFGLSGEKTLEPFTSGLRDAMVSLAHLAELDGTSDTVDIGKIDEDFVTQIESVIEVLNRVVTLSKSLPQADENGQMPNLDIGPIITIVTSAATALADLASDDTIDLDGIDETLTTTLETVVTILSDVLGIVDQLPDAPTEDNPGKNMDITPILGIINKSVLALSDLIDNGDLEKIAGEGSTLSTQIGTVIGIIQDLIGLSGGLSGGDEGGSGSATMDSITSQMDIQSLVSQVQTAAAELAKLVNDPNLQTIGDGGQIIYHIQNFGSIITEMGTALAPLKSGGGAMKAISEFVAAKIDMAAFASKVGDIANNLKNLVGDNSPFKDLAKGGALDDLDGVFTCIEKFKAIVTAANGLKVEGGGDGGELVTLATNLETAAPKLVNFNNDMKDVKQANTDKAKAIVEKMTEAGSSGETGEDLVTLGTNLEKLGANLLNFSQNTADLDAEGVAKKIETIAAVEVDASKFQEFAKGVQNAMKQALEAVNNSVPKFTTAGTKCANGLAKGIRTNKTVKTAGKTVATQGAQGAQSTASSGWYQAGVMCCQGLASGIQSSSYLVTLAAVAVVRQALDAAKAAADSHSPSREFAKIGKYCTEGLALGIADKPKIRKAKLSAATAVKATITAAKKSAEKEIEKTGGGGLSAAVWKYTTLNADFGKKFVSALKSSKIGVKAIKSILPNKKSTKEQIEKWIKNVGNSVKITQGLATFGAKFRKVLNDSTMATKAKYNPFNENALIKTKKGLEATVTYLVSSVKDGKISKALALTKDTLVKKINDIYSARVKKTGVKYDYDAMKEITKNVISGVDNALSYLDKELSKITKKHQKTIYSIPEVIAGYLGTRKDANSYASGVIKQFNNQFGNTVSAAAKSYKAQYDKAVKAYNKRYQPLAKKRADLVTALNSKALKGKSNKKKRDEIQKEIDAIDKQINKLSPMAKKISELKRQVNKFSSTKGFVESFAEQLYLNSDQYKNDLKQVNTDTDAVEKLYKKRKKLQDKLKKQKKGSDKYKSVKKELDSLNKEITKAEKTLTKSVKAMAKGPEKALKEYRKAIRDTVKEMGKLSNINLAEDLFSGFNLDPVEEKFNFFSAATSMSLEKVADAASDASKRTITSFEAATEAFDVLSNSFSTGMNLLEKFTKTGTAEPLALKEHAQTQLEAYDEWINGLEEMEKRGFNSAIIDQLEEQGMDSINYVRGFLEMTDDEVGEYNDILTKKAEREQRTLERNAKKQKDRYQQWMDDINTITAQNVGEAFVEKLKAAGVSQAEFVRVLAQMPGEMLRNFVTSYYDYSTSDTALDFIDNKEAVEKAEETGSTAGEKTVTSFLEALATATSNESRWRIKLGWLEQLGFSSEVINYFKEMGQDSGEQWLDSLMDSMGGENLTNLLAQASTYQKNASEATDEATKAMWEGLYNDVKAQIDAVLSNNQSTVDYVNSKMAEQTEDKFDNIIGNMRKENDSWDAYNKNLNTIDERAKSLAGEQKTKFEKVAKSIKELGYSEAEAAELMAQASIDKIMELYDELDRRKNNNAKNSTTSLFSDYHDIRAQQTKYASDMKWAAENLYQEAIKAGLNSTQATKFAQELYDELKGMGTDKAIEYIDALKLGLTTDEAGFKGFVHDYYMSNLVIPNRVADQVTASTAYVAQEGFKKAATQSEETGKSEFEQAATNVITKTASVAMAKAEEGSKEAAKTAVDTFVGGINNTRTHTRARTAGETTSKFVKKGMDDNRPQVRASGNNTGTALVNGLIQGIEAQKPALQAEINQLAAMLQRIMALRLQINSPSKVFMRIGESIDEGLMMGIEKGSAMPMGAITDLSDQVTSYATQAYSMLSELANTNALDLTPAITVTDSDVASVESLQDELAKLLAIASDEIDTNPVITPELDLTDVRRQAQEANSLFDNTQANINALNGNIQNGQVGGMTFVQNNYSPEALDRLEIYRQTNNLFARAKGMVQA